MPLWIRLIAVFAALVLGAAAAGCGGGDDDDGNDAADVPADAIAVVGDRAIPKTEYDRLLSLAQASYEAREQEFPEAGTEEFAQLRTALVRSLVQRAEFEIAAEELGIGVTDEEVDKRLEEVKQQSFGGDEDAYQAALKEQGLTEEAALQLLRDRILSEKISEEVTSEVEVTDEDVQAYYEENQAQFEQPASRKVRHILVKSKALADRIHRELENGADFAQLAKRYSEDPGSKNEGGELTAQKGATVPPFDKTAFELDTGELSDPVKTQFGWHIIEAVDDVVEANTQDLSAVEEQIRATLLDEKKNTRINEWAKELEARFEDQISYAPGFEPPPESETSTGETGTEPAPTDTE
jgi:parvulin-like peptidyl-prolyl isomerase